ncbi:MAG TPA: penicillin-binding transpeptidase domain-containing protein [Frankiaceae bacterium]|nr:penicillin-binding transpeptidase domain-containing protein [Frankiaceae bacterium]
MVVLLIGGGAAVIAWPSSSKPDASLVALQAFARSWSAGKPQDGPLVDPTGVAPAYQAATKGLNAGPPSVTVLTPAFAPASSDGADKSRARVGNLHVRWTLRGGTVFAYDTTAAVVPAADGHGRRVQWSPAVIHPGMRAGDTLIGETVAPPRAAILGAGDSPIVTEQPVVNVGVEPSRVTNLPQLSQQLATLLQIDPAALTARVKAATANAFVDVITLRQADYERLKAQLQPLPGTVFQTGQLPLAPTHDFARAVLGTVGPVTADLIKAHPGRYHVGQQVGLSGIQAQYDQQLAGTEGYRVVLHRAPGSAAADATLLSVAAKPGQPVHTTLDPAIQTAADNALAGQAKPSALVAIRVSTGDVLAVSNGPNGGAYDLALTGQAPPGSTFKIVTTLALLEGGLTPDTPVECAPTITVNGRTFHNAEAESFGLIPFHTDFARSCNTAFVSLAPRLSANSLQNAASSLGIGVPFTLGVSAYAGSVPVTTDPVDKAASAFGQGRVLTSPLAITTATASVARGVRVAPRLVLGSAAPAGVAAPLPAGPINTLRELMREVVTSGTGTALAGVPGLPVYGKTGTAEFGSGPNPPSHAWFTGWQGDIAFGVFVQGGEFGGDTAAPIAARFLTALAAGN